MGVCVNKGSLTKQQTQYRTQMNVFLFVQRPRVPAQAAAALVSDEFCPCISQTGTVSCVLCNKEKSPLASLSLLMMLMTYIPPLKHHFTCVCHLQHLVLLMGLPQSNNVRGA